MTEPVNKTAIEAPIRVTLFHRLRSGQGPSSERVFHSICEALPPEVEWRRSVCRYPTEGIVRRIYNMFEAMGRQGDINHIVGDVHYLSLLLRGGRTILTIYDCRSMLRLTGWRRWLFRWLWLVLPVAKVALVTVISEETKQEVIQYTGCPQDMVRVIGCPVGKEFRFSPKQFNSAHPVILQVGTAEHKNLRRVADALKGIPCVLHIIGRLADEDRRRLANAGVEYRTSTDLTDEQMVQAYEACDMVVFASTYEGFGLPTVEGFTVGRPVVTSSIPPMSTISGGAACMVDPFSVESIRAGILRVIGDAEFRESLVARGRDRALQFRPEAIAAKYARIYDELLQRNGRRVESGRREEAA
jgi:glycosyltransferase involved in cell wall biosynthesis